MHGAKHLRATVRCMTSSPVPSPETPEPQSPALGRRKARCLVFAPVLRRSWVPASLPVDVAVSTLLVQLAHETSQRPGQTQSEQPANLMRL